jgi:hypothetical protein
MSLKMIASQLRKVTEDCNTKLQQAQEQLELVRELGTVKTGLGSENARLSEENARKERALRELEDVQLSNQDLVEEITGLKERNDVLELKIRVPRPASRPRSSRKASKYVLHVMGVILYSPYRQRVDALGRLLARYRRRTDALDRLPARGRPPSLLNIIPDNIKVSSTNYGCHLLSTYGS